MALLVKAVSKEYAHQHLQQICQLRIKVFRDFPYIYEGSIDYEVKYLHRYFEAPNACFIMAIDTEKKFKLNADLSQDFVIGVATCLPLKEEDMFVQKPFIENGFNIDQIFYFGESVLLPEYRGQGLGHLFFNEREAQAKAWPNLKYTTFCAVQRSTEHPLMPKNYVPLDSFWKKRGYQKNDKLVGEFSWQDLGENEETLKKMTYWLKTWSSNEL